MKASHIESSAYYAREKKETVLSYLLLSVILLSVSVHLKNIDIPVRKHRPSFFSPPSWQTREFRSSRKEHNAHCVLSKYQKICATVSYIKTDIASPELRLFSLNVSKSALILCQQNMKPVSYGEIRDLIPHNDFNIAPSFQRGTSRLVKNSRMIIFSMQYFLYLHSLILFSCLHICIDYSLMYFLLQK